MSAWRTLDGRRPLVIGHRGASGLLPEHTLEAYALALEQGAEVIEPDLVMSRDGVLIARHERTLARSTDVATHESLAGHRRDVDWYVDDLDRDELRVLRARQPWPSRPQAHDGAFAVPDFDQLLRFAAERAQATGAALTVYPELKDPLGLARAGLDPVPAFARALAAVADAPLRVWVQCFDLPTLRRLHGSTGLPCFALAGADTDPLALVDAEAGWLRGVAVDKVWLQLEPGLVDHAHRAGLEVHAWTFRDDALPDGCDDPAVELQAAFALGVDAAFCDFPATAVAARAAMG